MGDGNNDGRGQILRLRLHPNHPRVYEPLSIGPDIGILPNQVILVSMYTGLGGNSISVPLLPPLLSSTEYNDDHHDYTNLGYLVSYFSERARGGAVLMDPGGISPNWERWLSPFAAKINKKR